MNTPHLYLRSITSPRGRWLLLIAALVLVSVVAGLGHSGDAYAASMTGPGGQYPIWPGPNLNNSFKSASKNFVLPGEQLTFTIHLRNSGAAPAVASVVDPVPGAVTYVPGSVTGGGVYNAGTNTVSWTAVTVTMHGEVALSFAVTANPTTTPTIAFNTATINSGHMTLQRHAWVGIVPESLAAPDLSRSYKSASKRMVIPGEAVTYRIELVNTGLVTATANVTDPVPSQMSYVSGTVTGGGIYDPGSHTLSWNNVTVPARNHVSLSFVSTAANVTSPTLVINMATIVAGNASFQRWVPVVIAPHPVPTPRPNLAGSYKAASKRFLGPGEVLTYTIKLINSGTTDASVNVVDPVPGAMSYIAGTASDGGVYDPGTKTLTWSAITVPLGSRVALSFAVSSTLNVTRPILIMNTATISVTGDGAFQRRAPVLLVPTRPSGDGIPPVVHSLVIDDQDVLTSPTVTLHISATDNVGVESMYLREWELATGPFPHWAVVRSTGWITYQADYPWTLGAHSGAHFVGVWVADAARNVSKTDRDALDFASLLQPNTTVARKGVVPYLVYYEAGVDVTATLTPSSGDADLFVWYPGHFFLPDQRSTHPLTETDVVTFTTPRAGMYLFVVRGYTAATYDLSIEPGGGPRAWTTMAADATGAADMTNAPMAPNDPTKPDDLMLEPVLSQSGVDPLPELGAPGGLYTVYLPIIIR